MHVGRQEKEERGQDEHFRIIYHPGWSADARVLLESGWSDLTPAGKREAKQLEIACP